MSTAGDEHGTVTVWVLGLCVAVLFLGGLGLDLWRAVAVRRELAADADAAAVAGANALDEDSLRSGVTVVDPERARAYAFAVLARNSREYDAVRVTVDGDAVTVMLQDEVAFSLLSIFETGEPFTVRAFASARPDRRE